MSASTDKLIVRRIVVALDSSADSIAALEAAAQLAALTESELIGFYVEEPELLRLLEYPASQEIDFVSARRRRLEARDLERQIRAQVSQMRRTLRRIAERAGVTATFRTARGRVARELLASIEETDVVSVGVRGRSHPRGPGSTLRALLDEAGGRVLVLRRGMQLGPRLHVLYDGSPEAGQALSAALPLLEREGLQLTVLVRAKMEEREILVRKVREWLAERDLEGTVLELSPAELPLRELPSLLRRRGCGLLIATRPLLRLDRQELGRLLSRLECPVLVVG